MGCEVDFAWAAGFLDGEGSFMICRGRAKGFLKSFISADQTEKTSLEKLARIIGGKVHQRNRPTVTGKTVYHWQISSASSIREVVPLLLPHLTVKRQKAKILLDFCFTVPKRGAAKHTTKSRSLQESILIRMKGAQ